MPPITPVLELDDETLEPLALDGLDIPRIRYHGPPPRAIVRLGGKDYTYQRSYPVKGYGASLPDFLRGLLAAGKTPLLVERTDRFYLYTDS